MARRSHLPAPGDCLIKPLKQLSVDLRRLSNIEYVTDLVDGATLRK